MGVIGKLGTAASLFKADYRPPLAFYFRAGFPETVALARVTDLVGMSSPSDAKFQEVSGLDIEMEYEDLIEGGNNEFTHKLPLRSKSSNLVMKRGLLVSGSDMAEWCQDTIMSGLASKITPRDLFVELLAPDSMIPLMFWRLEGAVPVKWEVSSFNSQESAIVVETLEFSYRKMSIAPLSFVNG